MRIRRLAYRAAVASTCLAFSTIGLVAFPGIAQAANVLGSGPVVSGVRNNDGTSKCMDEYGPANDGAVVDLWDCNGSGVQNWSMMDDGTIQINGKCLDIIGNTTANGTFVDLWDCNGVGGQQWQAQNGALVNPQSGLCLDDPGGWNNNGNQLRIWYCNGSAAQQWSPPADVNNPGSDLVVSLDDGGLDPGQVNTTLTQTWPQSMGLPDNSSVNSLIQATYNRDAGAAGVTQPPNIPDAYMYVSGSTITTVIPAGDIPTTATNLPEWIASAIAAAVAVTASGLAWAFCTASFAASLAGNIVQPLCWLFGTFVWSIVGSAMNHVLLGGVPFSWRNALVYALVSAIGSGLVTWAGIALAGKIAGQLYPLWRTVGIAIRALYRWIRNAPAVADDVGNELGDVANNLPGEVATASQQNGLAYPVQSGAVGSGISGKCMDNNGGFATDGNTVQLWDCNGFAPAQSWTLYSNGNLAIDGMCLDIIGNSTANGTFVDLWDCNGVGGQVWQQQAASLVNPQSGLCLDNPGGWSNNGNKLRIWYCNGSSAQVWSPPGGIVTTGG